MPTPRESQRLTDPSAEPADLAVTAAMIAATARAAIRPNEATEVPVADLLDALVSLRWMRDELAVIEPALIGAARRAGASWQTLAPALGVASRQAAERRYLRLAPTVRDGVRDTRDGVRDTRDGVRDTRDGVGDTRDGVRVTRDGVGDTRDGRVRAERDRRAGHRAVTRWANDNTADLRRLAGQITALADLEQDSAVPIERLHHALADPDASALPVLLADTQPYLHRYPELANQVDSVTTRTEQVRRHTQQQRDSTDS